MLFTFLSLFFACSAKQRAIKKNNYPPEYRAEFIADCISTGGSIAMCECSADRIMVEYPSEQVIGVSYSETLTTEMANIGVYCMPLEEIKAQI